MTDEQLNHPADEPNRPVEPDAAPSDAAPVDAALVDAGDAASEVSPTPETPTPEEIAVVSPAEEPVADAVEADAIALPEEETPVEEATAEEAAAPRVSKGAIEEEPVDEPAVEMQWYILKVQSNREESIREALQRRVKIAGLDRFFGDVIIPIEKVTEVKGGRKRVVKRKLYPGYLVVHMEINDDTWFLVRETPGIGDFTGAAGRPAPMLPHEVARIVSTQEERPGAAPKLQIAFAAGDRVKINDGTFENFEGEVESIDATSGRVVVMINIFGRSTPVELEYWQVEAL